MHFRCVTHCAGIVIASLLAMSAAPASGGGFALHERSAAAQGASFAGADSGGDDVTFAGFNPAALRNVETFAIGANLSLILLDVAGETFNVLSSETSRTTFTDPMFVPALSAGYRLSEEVVLGLAVNSQFGLATEYPDNALAWPAGGGGLTSEMLGVTVTPLIAWEAAPELTLAAGPAIHYADVTLSRAIGAPGTYGSTFPDFPVGILEGDDFALGWQVGVLFTPRDGTTLGLSYSSGYTLDVEGTFRNPLGTVEAKAKAELPGVFGIGLRQALSDDLTLLANARYFTWRRFDQIAVTLPEGVVNGSEPTNYRDALFAGLGLEADIGHGVTLRGGIAYDNTPTTDRYRSVRVPDADRFWLSLGASYRASERVRLDLAYSLLLPQDSTVEANGTTILAPVDYGGEIHILSFGATLSF